MRLTVILFLVFLCSCSNTIYVVRHAEKAPQAPGGSSDVQLSAAGLKRAQDLKQVMESKGIKSVYSTNTIRTKTTAQPTSDHFGLLIETYNPRPDSAFITLLRSKKSPVLVVGHSNTIDDIANMLAGSKVVAGDLPETQFDHLYILKKKGKKFTFTDLHYGVPTP